MPEGKAGPGKASASAPKARTQLERLLPYVEAKSAPPPKRIKTTTTTVTKSDIDGSTTTTTTTSTTPCENCAGD